MPQQFWLFKSEPDVFSLNDLRASPKKTTCWDGVRNYQARNLLRDAMRVGDKVLFYHSRVEPMIIAGTAGHRGAPATPTPASSTPKANASMLQRLPIHRVGTPWISSMRRPLQPP